MSLKSVPIIFGYLVYFFEKACVVSGYLLGVNQSYQPSIRRIGLDY